jgi:hypothetical protein
MKGYFSVPLLCFESRLKSNRSNSFDVSILNECSEGKQSGGPGSSKGSGDGNPSTMSPSSWFVKRHQPMATKQRSADAASAVLSLNFEKSRVAKLIKDNLGKTSPTKDEAELRQKVVWDGSSGTKVDAQVLLSSAINRSISAVPVILIMTHSNATNIRCSHPISVSIDLYMHIFSFLFA